jgi:hypothetical protein
MREQGWQLDRGSKIRTECAGEVLLMAYS